MTRKVFLILLALVLALSVGLVACGGPTGQEEEEEEEEEGKDIDAPLQMVGAHSTLCTSDGSIRDDKLADYICSKIPKDGNGIPKVMDVKIMFNSCYGGGFADDFARVFGPGGACEGVPWVFGSASASNEPAWGWKNGINTASGFGSCWTDALAGADSRPNDETDGPGSIRDGTSDNVQEDFKAARDNDYAGPDHRGKEKPLVASGNGGVNIRWNAAEAKHEAVVFGGNQTDQRHHNNVNNVEAALKGVWPDGSYTIQKIDGGTTKNLTDAIDAACARLDSDTQLVLYFDDHGDRHFDVDEFMDWPLPYHIYDYCLVEFDLDAGWEEGFAAMYEQGDGPWPFISLELAGPIYGEEWIMLFNGLTIPFPAGNLTGELQLAVDDWTRISTGTNYLEIQLLGEVTEFPIRLLNLELSSGPINEIEKVEE